MFLGTKKSKAMDIHVIIIRPTTGVDKKESAKYKKAAILIIEVGVSARLELHCTRIIYIYTFV